MIASLLLSFVLILITSLVLIGYEKAGWDGAAWNAEMVKA